MFKYMYMFMYTSCYVQMYVHVHVHVQYPACFVDVYYGVGEASGRLLECENTTPVLINAHQPAKRPGAFTRAVAVRNETNYMNSKH